MTQLRERISVLEKKLSIETNISFSNNIASSRHSLVREQSGIKSIDTFALADYMGVGCLTTFITLIASKRLAQLQFIWLLGCLIFFLYYGINTFFTAEGNENADFKPETKNYVIDYSSEDEQYEMPYVYIFWYLSLAQYNITEGTTMNRTELSNQLLQAQGDFSNSVFIEYTDSHSTDVLDTKVSAHVSDDTSSSLGFWGFFKFDLSAPNPVLGPWNLYILLNGDAMSLNSTVSLKHIVTYLSREDLYNFPGGVIVKLDALDEVDIVDLNVVFYDETVTHKHGSDVKQHDIMMRWTQTTLHIDDLYIVANVIAESTDIVLLLTPNLEVEHWFEYVAFGYTDWMTGMGGLSSLLCATFLWVSYYIAMYFGDGFSMGILPGLTFTFSNYEDVHWIKRKMHQSEEAA